jgi:hypothetical protein
MVLGSIFGPKKRREREGKAIPVNRPWKPIGL